MHDIQIFVCWVICRPKISLQFVIIMTKCGWDVNLIIPPIIWWWGSKINLNHLIHLYREFWTCGHCRGPEALFGIEIQEMTKKINLSRSWCNKNRLCIAWWLVWFIWMNTKWSHFNNRFSSFIIISLVF